METIILTFDCFILLTLILMGICLMIGENETLETLANIIMLLWDSFPFIILMILIVGVRVIIQQYLLGDNLI